MTVKDTMELLKSVENILSVQVPMGVNITLDNILKDFGVDKEAYTNVQQVQNRGRILFWNMMLMTYL